MPALALIGSGPPGDNRWRIWFPALVVMGTACLVNASRCDRLHCYLTCPVFLIAAALSMLHGLHHTSVSWNWIGGGVLLGWLLGYGLECGPDDT